MMGNTIVPIILNEHDDIQGQATTHSFCSQTNSLEECTKYFVASLGSRLCTDVVVVMDFAAVVDSH